MWYKLTLTITFSTRNIQNDYLFCVINDRKIFKALTVIILNDFMSKYDCYVCVKRESSSLPLIRKRQRVKNKTSILLKSLALDD